MVRSVIKIRTASRLACGLATFGPTAPSARRCLALIRPHLPPLAPGCLRTKRHFAGMKKTAKPCAVAGFGTSGNFPELCHGAQGRNRTGTPWGGGF
ncbi:hypothetical protein BP1258A_2115 [Burkholderia pseudomallei 1258a]|nr:hypothetical protein BP1258A_2115 [Burkholderia pseudomallei 1258a]EIF64838.1 hypothetical protein BP1258B_2288 [Burkholderia pseudomallei 1258b]